jgi:phthalate 3,4-dioxygenase subunit alpha
LEASVDIAAVVAELERGLVPPAVYCDEELFDLERERIFARSWCFLAHESEIPERGDYVLRRIVDDSFIVVRDEDAQVQVLYNMCRHRGMQVCRAEQGNTSHFRCPYHAWTYKNTGALVGVPYHKAAYGGDEQLPRSEIRLVSAPRVAIHRGMIFASLNEDAPDLEEYLGGFAFFLDLYVGQSEAGIEVRGPQRWRVKANWKIAAENFCGDSYHTPHTHASIVEVGLFPEPKAKKRRESVLYYADVGGGTTYKLPTQDARQNLQSIGYPQEMVERMLSIWSPDQQRFVGEHAFMVSAATIFPNLSFVHNWPRVNEDDLIVPFTSIRLWQPVSATETEIYSWFAVDRLAPDSFKEASYKGYLMCFGVSGMFEQDDVENWTSITNVARGQLAKRIPLNNTMGLSADRSGPRIAPVADWPGPGRAFMGLGEYNQRDFLARWGGQMLDAGNGSANGADGAKPAGVADAVR